MKKYSVLGDSISTFEGYHPYNYSVYYENERCKFNGLESVNDTWWYIVGEKLGAELCVNDSYSGSRVSGGGFPCACSDKRLTRLKTECDTPDIIFVYMGFNDYFNGVKIENPGYLKIREEDGHFFFSEAYEYMLNRLKELYPNAQIVCGTLVRTKLRDNADWVMPYEYYGIDIRNYNKVIRQVCEKCGVTLADLAKLDIQYETLDTAHPTKEGHKTLAEMWLKCLGADFC